MLMICRRPNSESMTMHGQSCGSFVTGSMDNFVEVLIRDLDLDHKLLCLSHGLTQVQKKCHNSTNFYSIGTKPPEITENFTMVVTIYLDWP